ncbi:hypothetical protein MKW92_033465 [Papaver armeniacum]|nr:hypothetical protein MKW92_033465 [Papaver armeniacum]
MAKFIDIARSLLSVLFILVVAVDGRTIRTGSNKAIMKASVPASKNMPVATNNLSVNPNTNHRFLDTHRGSNIVIGLSELKKYFHRFGYLPDTNFTDVFDEQFESAVTLYQSKLGLPMSGRVDSATLSQVMSPRCGVPDNDDHNKLRHTTKHYSLITGRPTWNHSTVPLMLTYALLPEHIIHYIKLSDIRVAIKQAFSRWSSVIPVNFIETQDYIHANITIGFYYGDHGDRIPFRILALASGPRSGAYLHFNAAHTWAVDFNSEKSENAFDLETTAVHEIGHLLGLNHTSISEAIMWPHIGPRTKHVELALDDVNGAQALYGANPNFKLDSPNGKEVASSESSSSFGLREIITISICLLVKALFFLYNI